MFMNLDRKTPFKVLFVFMGLFFCQLNLFAQQELKHIRSGNDYYEEQDFEKARQSYLKGVEANADSYGAAFNLGDALYKSGQYEEATKHFESLVQKSQNSEQKAESYHNLGNALLETQKYQESVEAYKNALRNNPADEATRYNLAYAQQKLKEQEQQQQNQDEQNEDQQNEDQQDQDQQDQNKDQQNQDEQNEDQKKQDQQQQNQEGENKEQQAPEPQGISKEDAERLLEALQNQEQELQEELKKKKAKSKASKVEKDW
jgi:tetratricopeptide (TPR) repeat protein